SRHEMALGLVRTRCRRGRARVRESSRMSNLTGRFRRRRGAWGGWDRSSLQGIKFGACLGLRPQTGSLTLDSDSDNSIRFYFSFRSPYAWLASERLESELGDLGVEIVRFPIYPTPELFPNDAAMMPNKLAYIVQDVARLARERGLTVRFPPAADPDWSISH